MQTVRALVITGYGINCEEEMAAAFGLAGARAEIVHCSELVAGARSVHDYDVVSFPGGFSFGDDLGAGKALANRLRFRRNSGGATLLDELRCFVDAGGCVLGVCNGFQALVKMGLLPNTAGRCEQEVSLTINDSGVFEDRWVRCRPRQPSPTPFLEGLELLDLPVRHKEGKLVIRDESVRAAIRSAGLDCLTYSDANGAPTAAYPENPNGSDLDCAGLCDPTGRVLGIMPHPEAFLSAFNHPNWGQLRRRNPQRSEDGAGLAVFRNIVSHIAGGVGPIRRRARHQREENP